MPASPYDAKGLLISAIRDPDPVIFFEPKRIYRAFREEVPEDEYTIPIGTSRVVVEGDEITMVSWGAPVIQCMTAIEESGRSIELIDLRFGTPRTPINTLFGWYAVLDDVGERGELERLPRGTGEFGAELGSIWTAIWDGWEADCPE